MLVDADVGALVVSFQALVDVPTPALLVPPQSLRAQRVLAREAVLQKRQTVGADALVASQRVGAIVGAIVLVLEALVEILAGPPVLLEDETLWAAAFESVAMLLAHVGTIGEMARVDGDAQPLVLRRDHAGWTGARVRPLNVHALVGALVSPFQALVRVLAGPRVVAQQITQRATALESTLLVRTLVGATVSPLVALVYVHAIEETAFSVRQPVTLPARASVIPNGIHADLLALVTTLQTLVHVRTGPVVVVQSEPGSTAARVTPVDVHALVLAIVNIVGALVHVRAIELVQPCFETLRAGAQEPTLQVHAGVRAQVQSALVLVHAAHLVLVDAITSRANARRPVLRLLALVRARCRQCFATSRPSAGEIVLFERESPWTGALERALGVVATVGARFDPLFALVDIAARYAVLSELETQVAGAVVTAWLVHALVLAAGNLSLVRAFVDICWKCIGKAKRLLSCIDLQYVTFSKFEINIRKYSYRDFFIFSFLQFKYNIKLRIDSFLLNYF